MPYCPCLPTSLSQGPCQVIFWNFLLFLVYCFQSKSDSKMIHQKLAPFLFAAMCFHKAPFFTLIYLWAIRDLFKSNLYQWSVWRLTMALLCVTEDTGWQPQLLPSFSHSVLYIFILRNTSRSLATWHCPDPYRSSYKVIKTYLTERWLPESPPW